MSWVALAATAAQTVVSARGAIKEGKEQERAANQAAANKDFEAGQYDENAAASFAKGTHLSYEEQRRGEKNVSDAIAAMAAGGGDASDAGAQERQAALKNEGDFNSLGRLYEGKVESNAYRTRAAVTRMDGDELRSRGETAREASRTKALSTVLGGVSKFASQASSAYGSPG